MGDPLHSNLLGPRVPQRSTHAGAHKGMGQAGESHAKLPAPPTLPKQPSHTTMAYGPPRNSAVTRQRST